MKILRIIYDWPPPWQGLAPHPYELTTAQADIGHEIEIFCGRWPNAGDIQIPKNTKVHPILREPLPGSIFFTSSVILFFKYLKWRFLHKVDVIHAHGHFGIWIYTYRRFLQKFFPWARELKTPMIVHFHNVARSRRESFEDQGIEMTAKTKYVSSPLEEYCDKVSVEIAAACIFVSEDNKKAAIDYYKVDPRRCFVVETGVNLELFAPIGDEEKEKSRKDLGLDLYDKVVLNHGALVERKNVHLLVEAMKYLPHHYKLLIAGSGDDVYVARLNEIIKNNGLGERVIRIGYTPYPQTPIAYQVSDIFVLPSGWEGLPKVVMQGLACGVPCLVSGFKLSQFVEGLFYLNNLDPQNIAKQIIEVAESKSVVDRGKVASFYSWELRAKEIDKIYDFAKKYYLV